MYEIAPGRVYMRDQSSSAEIVVRVVELDATVNTDQFAVRQTGLRADGALELYEKVSSAEVTLSGSVRAWEIVEVWKRPANDFSHRGKEFLFVADERGYTISAISELSEWAEVEPIVDGIMESLIVELADTGVGTPTATPTAVPVPTPSVYVSEDYWYSITVPVGWQVDSSDGREVLLSDQDSPGTVRVAVIDIDPAKHPTLDRFLEIRAPTTTEALEDFRALQSTRIRSTRPVQAEEIVASFTDADRKPWRERVHWYVLGRHAIEVDAALPRDLWENDSALFTELIGVQASFRPQSFISERFNYSLAHPSTWTPSSRGGSDYHAVTPEGAEISVRILPALGYTSLESYGDASGSDDWNISRRGIVHPGRTVPGYRIDYIEGNVSSWSVLISLRGDEAIWVIVGGVLTVQQLGDLRPIFDDIFLRLAVSP